MSTNSLQYYKIFVVEVRTGYWDVEYSRTFTARGRWTSGLYTLGAKVDGYVTRGRAPFSFGVYLRATPSFVLKRF